MLFDKTGFYMPGVDDDYDFALDVINGTGPIDRLDLYEPSMALRLGNSFPSLYKPYKNYEPVDVVVKTEREKSLLKIQELDFIINDLNLYLDLHPDDTEVYRKFVKYTKDSKLLKDEYTRVFGPLTLDDLTESYEWSKGVWPWEEGGM